MRNFILITLACIVCLLVCWNSARSVMVRIIDITNKVPFETQTLYDYKHHLVTMHSTIKGMDWETYQEQEKMRLWFEKGIVERLVKIVEVIERNKLNDR